MTKPRKVHLIDDDADVRTALALLLKSNGFDVTPGSMRARFWSGKPRPRVAASSPTSGCQVSRAYSSSKGSVRRLMAGRSWS